MKQILSLTKRNVKLFFRDKGMLISSLITPVILLFLYAVFLFDIYRDTFTSAIPAGIPYDKDIIDGLVGGLLLSSLLAVSTITVSFCANLYMVQDKVTKARNDLTITPVKPYKIALGYYFGTFCNGMIISLVALTLGCVYLAFTGWYLSFLDILALLGDVILLVLLGTSLSSLICYPLTTQGQLSAVGTIISAGYGFLCGAYMPLAQYGEGLRNVLMCLPGTYGTSLLRNHALRGVYAEMESQNFPAEALDAMKTVSDCRIEFFGHRVEVWQMYLVLAGAVVVLTGGYILIHYIAGKCRKKQKKTK